MVNPSWRFAVCTLRKQGSRKSIGDLYGFGMFAVGQDRDRVSRGGIIRQIDTEAKFREMIEDIRHKIELRSR